MWKEDFKYNSYLSNNQETRWATADEIKSSAAYVNLDKNICPSGGLPLISDGNEIYVDDKDTHNNFRCNGFKENSPFLYANDKPPCKSW